MYRIVAASAWLAAAAPAHAGRFEDGYGADPTQPLGFALERVAPTPTHDRPTRNELNVRLRTVRVPNAVLDTWYYDDDTPDWAYVDGRPPIGGVAMGLEYVLKGPHHNALFYAEFVDSSMPAGYFDDIEPEADHLDGDFVVPSKGLGVVGVGVNYLYEAPLVKSADTGGRFQLGYLIGGGLGLGALVGDLDRWGADQWGNPGYQRWQVGEDPDEDRRLTRAVPLVDVTTGFRFTFGDRVVLRAEGGLHTALYLGTSAGVMF